MPVDKQTVDELTRMLIDFVNGTNRSIEFANRLEMKLNDAFPDDERIEELTDALALYQPGGTGYFTNEKTVSKLCVWVIELLKKGES
jgi:hypothetical protein